MVLLYQHRVEFQTAGAREFYEQLDGPLGRGTYLSGHYLGRVETCGRTPPEVMPTSTGLAFLRFITDPHDNLEAACPHP